MQSELILDDLLKVHQEMLKDVKEIKETIMSIPEWISAADIARNIGLKTQSVLKQLYSGDFEPEVDYKLINNRMYIARDVVFRIKRFRK